MHWVGLMHSSFLMGWKNLPILALIYLEDSQMPFPSSSGDNSLYMESIIQSLNAD